MFSVTANIYKKETRNTYTNVPSTFSSNHFPPTTELHSGKSDYRTHPVQT